MVSRAGKDVSGAGFEAKLPNLSGLLDTWRYWNINQLVGISEDFRC
jgi:hypothetical protein